MKRNIVIGLFAMLTTMPALAQYRDVKLPEKPKQTGYRDYENQDYGFWFATEVEGGSTLKGDGLSMQFADAAVTAGYRFNQFLKVGVGVGGRYYFNNGEVRGEDSKWGVPVFANVRGNIISAYDRGAVPFWSVRLGTIINEGLYFSPSVGYSFGGMHNNFQLSVAYVLTNPKYFTLERQTTSAFTLRLGYEF